MPWDVIFTIVAGLSSPALPHAAAVDPCVFTSTDLARLEAVAPEGGGRAATVERRFPVRISVPASAEFRVPASPVSIRSAILQVARAPFSDVAQEKQSPGVTYARSPVVDDPGTPARRRGAAYPEEAKDFAATSRTCVPGSVRIYVSSAVPAVCRSTLQPSGAACFSLSSSRDSGAPGRILTTEIYHKTAEARLARSAVVERCPCGPRVLPAGQRVQDGPSGPLLLNDFQVARNTNYRIMAGLCSVPPDEIVGAAQWCDNQVVLWPGQIRELVNCWERCAS